MKEELTY